MKYLNNGHLGSMDNFLHSNVKLCGAELSLLYSEGPFWRCDCICFTYCRDLKMENIMLDRKKRQVKIVGE